MSFSGYAKLPQFSYQKFDAGNVKFTNIPWRPPKKPDPPKDEDTEGNNEESQGNDTFNAH